MIFVKGLADLTDQGGDQNTERFDFIDPTLTNKSFFLTPSQFPWKLGEPNDFDNSENAVE